MRITCPNCEASYQLADGALGATGRKVRCTRCGKTWHATPFEDEAPADPVQAWAAAAGKAEPTEDHWKAALSEPVKQAKAEADAAAAASDDDADPWAAVAAEAADAAAPAASTAATAAEGPASNVVPFRRDDGPEAPDGAADAGQPAPGPEPEPTTIEADPAGFPPKAAKRAKPKPRRTSRFRNVGSGLHAGSKPLAGFLAGTVALLLIGGVFAREDLVRLFPELASLYATVGVEVNLRGLAFEDIRTVREMDGATPVLVVSGVMRNVTEETRPVPRIRFGLMSRAGREVYAWTMEPANATLDAGATMPFRSRLPAPPEAAADVQVRFTDDTRP